MTLAELCLSRQGLLRKPQSLASIAKKLDNRVHHDLMEEGIHIFYFRDGSTLASKGRGRNHQAWVL